MSRHTSIAISLLLLASAATPAAQSQPEDFHTSQAMPVQNGGVLNDHTYTHASDDQYESITETLVHEHQQHAPRKYNSLEHKWAIPVGGDPDLAWAFYLEAHHTPSEDGDHFDFAWSPDDITYYHMLRVTKTSDNDTYQTYRFYVPLSGTIYIRVVDTSSAGNPRYDDTVYVDHMYIRNYVDDVPPVITNVAAETVSGPAWVNLSPEVLGGTLAPRELHAMAYDSAADKTILFSGSNDVADTWAYDYTANTWDNRNPIVDPGSGPLDERVGHAMVYDSAANRIIMFGGCGGGHYDENGQWVDNWKHDDTWAYAYSINTWTNRAPNVVGGDLTGREHHAMAYDPVADRTIMVGGAIDGAWEVRETWVYDCGDNTWYNQTPTMTVVGGELPAISGQALAYVPSADPEQPNDGRIIMFGGWTPSGRTSDTWAYDCSTNTWYNMTPDMTILGGVLIPRARHAMVYEASTGKILMFGGQDESGERLGDTWTYDYYANTWQKVEPEVAGGTLSPREELAMVYDSTNCVTILFGGFQGDAPYDVGDTWMYTDEPTAVISWRTDEPSDSVVRHGTVTPPTNSVGNLAMARSHSVVLRSLVEYPVYYYYEVQSTDFWNNTSVDDNGGAYYTFTIGAPNNAPEAPSDPSPADGATGVGLDVSLSVYVFDPDGDEMEVSFYDESGVLIGTAHAVPSGTRASMPWEGLSPDTTYGWYTVAEDSEASTQSATWHFTTAPPQPPDAPSDPSPADGATAVGPDVNLSVYVYDPDGDEMQVFFYDEFGSLIGIEYAVPSGTRAGVLWEGLLADTTYGWYAIADDSEASTESETWHFTTASAENAMHVSTIDMWYTTHGSKYKVYTEVMVLDAFGVGVEGATVDIETALPDGGVVNDSGSTESDGSVTFRYGPTGVEGTYTSMVTAVAKDGWTYDNGQNVETSETLTVP